MAIGTMNRIFRYATLLALAAVRTIGASAGEPAQKDTLVSMPWQSQKSYWQSATSTLGINLEDAEKSPVYDLRNKFTGIVPGLEVIETSGAIVPGSNLTSNVINSNTLSLASRGFSSLVLIVDDVIIPFNQFQFDLNQIESVTLLNDAVAKAKYGPRASYGALYIKTRKGSYNSPMRVTADFRSGINMVDRMPEWVNGYEYAVLNNNARANDGYPMLYDSDALEGFKRGNMFDRQYPSVDYRSLMMRQWMPSSSFGVNLDGGSAGVRYSFSINGLDNQDIYNVGPAAAYNKINLSSSISAKIGRWIEANVSFFGMTSFRQGNNGSLTGYRSIPAISFPVALGISTNDSDLADISAGNVIYAVSRAHTENPYAKMVDGGFFTTRYRSADFNATIDFDMSWLLPGLKSKTFVNTNNYYYQTVGKTNDYIAYYWSTEDDIKEISSHVGTKQASKSSKGTATYQSLSMYERLYWDWARDGHKLNTGLTYFISNVNHSSSDYYERQNYAVANADWSYMDRYIVEAALQYAGSARLAPGNRYHFFPSASFAWIASNEDFLKGNSVIDRMKVHAGTGLLADADIFGSNYLYRSLYTSASSLNYGPATAYQWFGSDKRTSQTTTIDRLSNPNLQWGGVFQMDAGIDVDLLDCLSVRMNLFRSQRTNLLTETSGNYPAALGIVDTQFYDNYNEYLIMGGELSLQYRKSFGDFRLSAGADAMFWTNTRTKVAGDIYLYDWKKITGCSANAYRGFVCLGKFQNDEEIAASSLYDVDTRVGDLKYEDLNGDGVIDDNDIKVIGDTSPKFRYSLNLDLSWKNFNLFVVGTGRAFYQIPLTGDYFWNGWGDGNYSKFIVDNLNGEYPRLGYDKAVNNFVKSSFWLRDGGYFKIQTVELGYTLPFKSTSAVKSVKFSVRGSNLLTLTKIKYIDPESDDAGIGSYPLYRTVAVGAKLNF